MNILAIGDIYSREGRKAISEILPNLIKKEKVDFVIANGENITHGKGINKRDYNFLLDNKVDCITSGNHIFKNKEVFEIFDDKNVLLRPGNWYYNAPGVGSKLFIKNNIKIRVTNLIGKVFMDYCNNPYETMDKIVEKKDWDIHLVDFHAEASAEKIAFAYCYDGVISGLYGTHTHVQTADERVLKKGTAFITDIGMTGCTDSIIGAEISQIIDKERYNISRIIQPASGSRQLCGTIFKFNNEFKVNEIKRVFIKNK